MRGTGTSVGIFLIYSIYVCTIDVPMLSNRFSPYRVGVAGVSSSVGSTHGYSN